ncbi:hypothetical protein [Teichococcus wenyumeiae]|uniref:hypothetical protein n=1 Tax=Teichococcus wenyumeiae TaxID=2478470 RepID=UPI001314FAAA
MQADTYAGFSDICPSAASLGRSRRRRAGRVSGARYSKLAEVARTLLAAEAVRRID